MLSKYQILSRTLEILKFLLQTQDVGGNNYGGTKEIDNFLVVDVNFRT